MEIDILNQKDNKVLNRNEVKFVCDYEGEATPKIIDVKNKLVSLLNSKKDLLVVDSLQPHFGEAKALGYAKVYDSKEDLEYIETESVMSKNVQKSVPAKEKDEAPVDENNTEDESAKEAPADENNAEDESAKEAPADEGNTEDESAKEAPADENNADEKSVEDESVDENSSSEENEESEE